MPGLNSAPKPDPIEIDPKILDDLKAQAEQLKASKEFIDKGLTPLEIKIAIQRVAEKRMQNKSIDLAATLEAALKARVDVRPVPAFKARIINERGDIVDTAA